VGGWRGVASLDAEARHAARRAAHGGAERPVRAAVALRREAPVGAVPEVRVVEADVALSRVGAEREGAPRAERVAHAPSAVHGAVALRGERPVGAVPEVRAAPADVALARVGAEREGAARAEAVAHAARAEGAAVAAPAVAPHQHAALAVRRAGGAAGEADGQVGRVDVAHDDPRGRAGVRLLQRAEAGVGVVEPAAEEHDVAGARAEVARVVEGVAGAQGVPADAHGDVVVPRTAAEGIGGAARRGEAPDHRDEARAVGAVAPHRGARALAVGDGPVDPVVRAVEHRRRVGGREAADGPFAAIRERDLAHGAVERRGLRAREAPSERGESGDSDRTRMLHGAHLPGRRQSSPDRRQRQAGGRVWDGGGRWCLSDAPTRVPHPTAPRSGSSIDLSDLAPELIPRGTTHPP